MKKSTPDWRLLAVLLLILFSSCSRPKSPALAAGAAAAGTKALPAAYYTRDDFKAVEKYDTHVHLNTADTSLVKQAIQDNFRLLTINVDATHYPTIVEQQVLATGQVKAFPERVAYATTISVKDFTSPDWQSKTINYLKDSFARGAVAVKLWKNIGMELKDQDGKFVMIDHPKFDPIIDFIAQNKITVIGHLGEPKNCWLPLEKMDVKNNRNYYQEHPEYHMYLHPEYPSYEAHIAARDRMLAKHPDLTFVGAHLGSLEWSVEELAARLDKFPNMAVDMAARIPHFQVQSVTNWQQVHDFFLKYQDRLIYATDIAVDVKMAPAVVKKRAQETWRRDWQYFTSEETMTVPSVDKAFKGLKLPREVIDKIYRRNADKWIPGLQ